MTTANQPGVTMRLLLRVAGAGLLIATASLHLDLYLTGYRTIPTIGWLFLLQVIVAYGLGALVLVTGNRLVAAAGAGFALATLGGYLLTLQFGLFGFREVRTTAGIVAGIIEVAAFVALAALAALPAAGRGLGRGRERGAAGWAAMPVPYAAPAVAGVSVIALGLFGGALAVATSTSAVTTVPAAAGGAMLRTENVGGATVLANAQGRTLYWFAPDSPGKSVCYGQCAQYWPPVPGPDHGGNGITGTLATIRRTGGALQETYNGHPLYTYVGDTGPGQAHGNNLDLNGGFWHEVVVAR
jgi:predicted lipoprotein with Yx(FWY)xxD motif